MGKATIGGRHRKKKKKKIVYVTRSKCLRYLQVPLSLFRHLCILKGVYPKEPRRRKSGQLTYFFRDVKLLSRDPLLQTYRTFQTFLKRLRKATDRSENSKQENLIKWEKPEYEYDHLVRERYSTFSSAVRDLADCLSLLFMIRLFPGSFALGDELLSKVKKYVEEFVTYVVYKDSCLDAIFVTLKGVYIRCFIDKIPVVWLMPHAGLGLGIEGIDDEEERGVVSMGGGRGKGRMRRDSSRVDIFKSFVLYYVTLMKFVNFRLFTYNLYPEMRRKRQRRLKYPLTQQVLQNKVFPESFAGTIEQLDENGTDSEGVGVGAERSPTVPVGEDDITQIPEEMLDSVVKKQEGEADGVTEMDIGDDSVGAPVGPGSGDDGGEVTATTAEMEYQETFGRSLENRRRRFLEESRAIFRGMTFFISRECPRPILEIAIRAFKGRVVPSLEDFSGQLSFYIVERDRIPADIVRQFDCVHPQWIFDSVNSKMRLPVDRYRPGATLPPHLSPFVNPDEQDYVPEYAQEIQRLTRDRLGIAPDADEEVEEVVDAGGDEPEDEETVYQRELEAERSGVKYREHVEEVAEKKQTAHEEEMIARGVTSKTAAREKQRSEDLDFRSIILSNRKRKRVQGMRRRDARKARKVRGLRRRKAAIVRAERTDDAPAQLLDDASASAAPDASSSASSGIVVEFGGGSKDVTGKKRRRRKSAQEDDTEPPKKRQKTA